MRDKLGNIVLEDAGQNEASQEITRAERKAQKARQMAAKKNKSVAIVDPTKSEDEDEEEDEEDVEKVDNTAANKTVKIGDLNKTAAPKELSRRER